MEEIRYLPGVNEVASDFVDSITNRRRGENLELRDFDHFASRWSLESSGLLVFERRLGALFDFEAKNRPNWHNSMIRANADIFELSGILKFRLPFYRYFSTPKWKRLVAAEDYFYGETNRLTSDTIAEIKQPAGAAVTNANNSTFMRYLLNRPELTKEDMTIIALSLFADGLSTTAPMLVYCLYCIAKNPEVQHTLRHELKLHIGGASVEITPEMLNKHLYLKSCLKETFRMFPIGTEVSRITKENLVLNGYQIPTGSQVDICLGPSLRNAEYFPEPNRFKPDRWLRKSPEYTGDKVHPYAFLPFGHGPRMCAGRRFAEQDLQVVLAKLISKFNVEHHHGEMGQKLHTLLFPHGSCQFSLKDY